jgi:hypothetical protein
MTPLFKKKLKPSDLRDITKSWLSVSTEILHDTYKEYENEKGNKTFLLAIFSIINTLNETNQMITKFLGAIPNLGNVLLEFRIYYDCIWQLSLFNMGISKEKLLNISTDIKSIETSTYKMLFEQNTDIEKYAKIVLTDYEPEIVLGGEMWYLPMKFTDDKKKTVEFERQIVDDIDIQYWNTQVESELDSEILKMAHKLWHNLLEHTIVWDNDYLYKIFTLQFYNNTKKALLHPLLMDKENFQ